jgi:hypothetical protein
MIGNMVFSIRHIESITKRTLSTGTDWVRIYIAGKELRFEDVDNSKEYAQALALYNLFVKAAANA